MQVSPFGVDKFQPRISQCPANNSAGFRAGNGTAALLLVRVEPVSLHHVAFYNPDISLDLVLTLSLTCNMGDGGDSSQGCFNSVTDFQMPSSFK